MKKSHFFKLAIVLSFGIGLCFAPQAHAAITFVKSTVGVTGANSTTFTLNATTTTGDTVVAVIAVRAINKVLNVTSSALDSFTEKSSSTNSGAGDFVSVWTSLSVGSDTSFTATVNSSAQIQLNILEYSGVNAIGNVASTTTSGNTATTTITLTNANDFIVAGFSTQDSRNITGLNGTTIRVNNNAGAAIQLSSGDNTTSTATALIIGGTWTGGTANAALAAVELKVASVSPGTGEGLPICSISNASIMGATIY